MKALLTVLLLALPAFAGAADTATTSAAPAASEPRFSSGWRFEQRSGPALYGALCAACHMPDGRGARGAGSYPALQANPRLAATPYALHMVLNGHRAMPGFGRQLSDEQVAAVLSHVRERFGGLTPEAARVTPAEAAEVRQAAQAGTAVAH
ncbi:c-type cytochrome [Pelomonas sp. APW6]|uniref:C-type cytochrome n=1 Tax=Roseateles subflavus TaxID=3053353 RepID=A0ABT7LC98_9BURK|nr:c-type cytochrome [Pelomonas sp. APW6]MDL5030488.1 c-type cytochrome [Pelomonas sp. APW6]